MKTIQSFTKNHLMLNRGLYASTTNGITTVDLRMRIPYIEDTIDQKVMHTMEHIYATVTRDLYPDQTVYVGPMGCRTGFYFLFESTAEEAVTYIKTVLKETMKINEIPGNSITECGFALDFSDNTLAKALEVTLDLLENLNPDGSIVKRIDKTQYLKDLGSKDKVRLDAIYQTLRNRNGLDQEQSNLSKETLLIEISNLIQQTTDLFY